MIKNLKIENMYGYGYAVSFCNNYSHSFNPNYTIYPSELMFFEDCEFVITIPNNEYQDYNMINADTVERVSVYFTEYEELTEEIYVTGIEAPSIVDCYVLNDSNCTYFKGLWNAGTYVSGGWGWDEPSSGYLLKNCYVAQMGEGEWEGITSEYEGEVISIYHYNNTSNPPNSEVDSSPISVTEMQQMSSFVGWDFDNVWGIRPGVNYGFPTLNPTRGLLKVFRNSQWMRVNSKLKTADPKYNNSYLKTYYDGKWIKTNKGD